MKKEMKASVVCIIFSILLICFNLNLVFGGFELASGNESYSIESAYGFSEPVKGWINISLQDEPINSL